MRIFSNSNTNPMNGFLSMPSIQACFSSLWTTNHRSVRSIRSGLEATARRRRVANPGVGARLTISCNFCGLKLTKFVYLFADIINCCRRSYCITSSWFFQGKERRCDLLSTTKKPYGNRWTGWNFSNSPALNLLITFSWFTTFTCTNKWKRIQAADRHWSYTAKTLTVNLWLLKRFNDPHQVRTCSTHTHIVLEL